MTMSSNLLLPFPLYFLFGLVPFSSSPSTHLDSKPISCWHNSSIISAGWSGCLSAAFVEFVKKNSEKQSLDSARYKSISETPVSFVPWVVWKPMLPFSYW